MVPLRKLASVYKDAGVETFKIGKDVYFETINQGQKSGKNIFNTSGRALKDAMKVFKDTQRTSKNRSKSETLSIDDLLS